MDLTGKGFIICSVAHAVFHKLEYNISLIKINLSIHLVKLEKRCVDVNVGGLKADWCCINVRIEELDLKLQFLVAVIKDKYEGVKNMLMALLVNSNSETEESWISQGLFWLTWYYVILFIKMFNA